MYSTSRFDTVLYATSVTGTVQINLNRVSTKMRFSKTLHQKVHAGIILMGFSRLQSGKQMLFTYMHL